MTWIYATASHLIYIHNTPFWPCAGCTCCYAISNFPSSTGAAATQNSDTFEREGNKSCLVQNSALFFKRKTREVSQFWERSMAQGEFFFHFSNKSTMCPPWCPPLKLVCGVMKRSSLVEEMLLENKLYCFCTLRQTPIFGPKNTILKKNYYLDLSKNF